MQIRAEQAVAAGNMKRLRERIDGLTLLKVSLFFLSRLCGARPDESGQGQNVHDSIRTYVYYSSDWSGGLLADWRWGVRLIKHYESSSAPEDEVQTQSRRDMKAKVCLHRDVSELILGPAREDTGSPSSEIGYDRRGARGREERGGGRIVPD